MQPELARFASELFTIVMSFKQSLFLVLIFISGFLNVAAQEPDEEIIKVDSPIVRLNVGVVDDRGRPITDLSAANFTLYENGVKQKIGRFQPTATPFSVALLLDMSGSTIPYRQIIAQSAIRFIDALAPDDRIAVIEFYDKVNLLNDFTINRKSIVHSISVANGRGKTQLYKALDFALEKLSKESSRRKAIIVLTDGRDTVVESSDNDLLEKLSENEIAGEFKPESNIILNNMLSKADAQGVTIYPLALPTSDPNSITNPTKIQIAKFTAARARLETLAKRTGGTLNKINRLEDMSRLYAAVAADLRTLYTIEYEPINNERDGKWREIKLELDKPELISRTKTGYFAK